MTSRFAAAAVALLSASQAAGHMIMAYPVPFGDPDNSPLSSSGSNFPCKVTGDPATFYSTTSASSNNTMAVGETKQLSFKGSAVHGGGSCQLAITSDTQPSSSTTWQVIQSIEGGCPTKDGSGPSTYDFQIPQGVAAGNYVFAWTWISKLAGQPEYYMNCAPITVTAGSSSSKRDEPDLGVDYALPSVSKRDTLPNLFVANLASINSCKTTPGTDPVFPDPGSNVVKPSTMSTNFQDPSGTNCFPVGGTSSGGTSGGSDTANSTSTSAAATGTAGSGSGASASTGAGKGVSTTAATSTGAASATRSASIPGGVFVTVTGSAGTTATGSSGATSTKSAATSAAATSAATTATSAASATKATSAAASATPSSGGNSTNPSSGSSLSGTCSVEGTFNCVGGSQYQQCASGSWTTLQSMPSGTTCQEGQSTTLWARDVASAPSRMRRVRRRGIVWPSRIRN